VPARRWRPCSRTPARPRERRCDTAGIGAIRFGPAVVPSRESPAAAVELLLELGYSACEIDFEGGFWMDWKYAERLADPPAPEADQPILLAL
jgi:hypothetical protein